MIFAKLDVQFDIHPKFCNAVTRGYMEACAYWCAVLTYLRRNDSEDGIMALHEIGYPLHVGHERAAKFCEQLVEVGLFERKEGGYLLLRYADKNELREDIETRRAKTRKRVAKHRAKLAGNGVTHGVTSPVTETNVTPSRAVFVPDSDSDSGSDSGSQIRERDPGLSTGADYRTVQPSDKLTAELREAAHLAGIREADVDSVWLKFCGHYAGQSLHVAGRWQYWCAEQLRRDRAAQARDSRYARPPAAEPPKPIKVTAADVAEMEAIYQRAVGGKDT